MAHLSNFPLLYPELEAQLRLAAKRWLRPKANVGARNPVGEMGHLRRLGGRWSALGGARRPRPAPAAAHRPCRSPGPHPAHSGPRTTAQAATRGQIRPPWAQIGWLQRACHGHVSVVCGQSTCPRGPGAVLRVPWGHARWCGVLGRPWGGSRPVVGSVSVHTSFLSRSRPRVPCCAPRGWGWVAVASYDLPPGRPGPGFHGPSDR